MQQIFQRESDNNKKKAAPSDKKQCAVKDVAATNTTVTQDGTQTEREPLIMQKPGHRRRHKR